MSSSHMRLESFKTGAKKQKYLLSRKFSKISGFTLIETLITVSIIAVLATAAVYILQPDQFVVQSYDYTRVNDLESLDKAIKLSKVAGYFIDNTESNKIYVSLPHNPADPAGACDSYFLPVLTSGWEYRCLAVDSASLGNTDSSGWIPIDLSAGRYISKLPVDPVNSAAGNNYYVYGWGAKRNVYSLAAKLDSDKYVSGVAAKDGGNDDIVYETNPAEWIAVGEDWVLVKDPAPWSARYKHSSVVFKNELWVMGGSEGFFASNKNDVWHSPDGVNWTKSVENAPWSARNGQTLVVFNNEMWVIGGSGGLFSAKRDVWHSPDGVNWTQSVANAPWSDRLNHTSVVFNNEMWVMGGSEGILGGPYRNDVWRSSDGVNWILVTSNADWSIRSSHSSIIFNGKMWVMGGFDGVFQNDVWYSFNGDNWTEAPTSFSWSARYGHSSVSFNNKMWVMGGVEGLFGPYKNDVWRSL